MILAATTDKFQLTTSAAVAVDVAVSYIDANGSTLAPSGGGKQNTAISTATTTDILSAPGSSTLRTVTFAGIRNKGASPCTVTWVFNQNGTSYEVYKTTLQAGETLTFTQGYGWVKTPNGVAFRNWSTAAQGAGFSSDTYVTGSFIVFPQAPSVGVVYECVIAGSKTAAGTATPIIQLRGGSGGTTSDASLCSFTFSAGTAATDQFTISVRGLFRTVGSGTSAVVQGVCSVESQPTTGFSSLLKTVLTTSSGFDSTTAGLGLGVSINGGASASWTLQYVHAQLIQ